MAREMLEKPQNKPPEVVCDFSALEIDVVLCTYNGVNYIREQLQSILDQTLPVARILIFDDQSSDGTVGEVMNFLKSMDDSFVRRPDLVVVVNEENLGFVRNFEKGVSCAKGDVIFLCDQDDIWEKNKVSVMCEVLADTGASMVFSDGTLVDHTGLEIQGKSVLGSLGMDARGLEGFDRAPFEVLLKRNIVNGSSCAIRAAVVREALPFIPGVPHDQWLAIFCAISSGIAVSRERLYRYRQHSTNVIGMGSGYWLYQWLGVWRQPFSPRAREFAVWSRILARLGPDCPGYAFDLLARKVRFLEAVVMEGSRLVRCVNIFSHLIRGSYGRFAPPYAFWRDLLSVVRTVSGMASERADLEVN